MQEAKKQNYLKGAAILAAASILGKIGTAVYKIPLVAILGNTGNGYFQTTYNIYALLLTISSAGIPVALSRMISSASARGNTALVKRYFSVAMPIFALIGAAVTLVMFFFADALAGLINNSLAAPGIRVLAPAVFFSCIISVYRGYMQGFGNMTPTAVTQVVEVVCKTAFGIIIAKLLLDMAYDLPLVSAGAILGVTIAAGLCIPLLVWYKRKHDRTVSPAIGDNESSGAGTALPGRKHVAAQLLKVSIPITIGASFLSIITVIDQSVVMGRLQHSLNLSGIEANGFFGIYSKCLNIYNLPFALIAPISISIVPAIAAALAGKNSGEAGGIMQSSVKLVYLLAMPACAGIIVLAQPILIALYNDPEQLTSNIMMILGAASFFVCLQLVTMAILQANGHERIAMITIPIGGAVQIVLDYFLVGTPGIGIIGSPFGTLMCFIVISMLNIVFIMVKIKDKPKFLGISVKPLLCTAIMAAAAFFTYRLLRGYGPGVIGTGRMAVVVFLSLTIIVAVVVYIVLIIVTRTITKEDMALVPKGEKLAKVLRIR